MKLALSEIFVISLTDSNIEVRGAASYYDMLAQRLRQLPHAPRAGDPASDDGRLSHWLGNQKEDPVTGRNPDENFARESCS